MRSVSAHALVLRNRPRHIGQLLREFLDRAMHQGGGGDIVAHQHRIEVALGNFVGGFFAQGIVAVFLQRLAQPVENLAEGALAGAVAEKALVVLQFDIEAVDFNRRQPGARRGARCRWSLRCLLPCCPKPLPDFAGDNGRGTHWFHGRASSEWRAANGRAASHRYSPFALFGQILHFWPVFGPLCLDSRLSPAISPGIRRGISRAACFCANS